MQKKSFALSSQLAQLSVLSTNGERGAIVTATQEIFMNKAADKMTRHSKVEVYKHKLTIETKQNTCR